MKLASFELGGEARPVRFIETIAVKEGVECDTYAFVNDDSKDLAIVRVRKGHKTPLQKVLSGKSTIEGFVSGQGSLTVRSAEGNAKSYEFKSRGSAQAITVQVGEVMQWWANGDTDLVFYEICEPPYKDGRFENLP